MAADTSGWPTCRKSHGPDAVAADRGPSIPTSRQTPSTTLGHEGWPTWPAILRSVEWWRLEPHPELVVENPSKYCLAVPGETYLMFLRWGGAVKLDLTAYKGATFTRQWIDLVTERRTSPRNSAEAPFM